MGMTSNLTELADRIEALTGPDRELNADILETLADERWRALEHEAALPCGAPPGMIRIEARYKAGVRFDFTGSLDAAMSLVPEGWRIRQLEENWLSGRWHCQLTPRPSAKIVAAFDEDKTIGYDSKDAEAATGPLAITAAALRARSATEASDAA